MSNAFSHPSSLPILGLLGGTFHFHSNIKTNFCKQTVVQPDQTPRFAASDLVLHCLPMSHKKDARLIWVKGKNLFSLGANSFL